MLAVIVLICGSIKVQWYVPPGHDSSLHFSDHQDRAIQIWQAIAEHYKDNTWVAGYNPMK
jgi:hypothetical protein